MGPRTKHRLNPQVVESTIKDPVIEDLVIEDPVIEDPTEDDFIPDDVLIVEFDECRQGPDETEDSDGHE